MGKRIRVIPLVVLLLISGAALRASATAPLDEAARLRDEGRLAEAADLCNRILGSNPGNLETLRLAAEIAQKRGDLQAAADYRCMATDRGGTEQDYLDLAGAYKALFQLERTLSTFERAAKAFPTERVYGEWAKTLLAYRLFDEASLRIEEALHRFPQSAGLLESRAELAAALERDDEAVRWIRESWNAGADPLSWTLRPILSEKAPYPPYRSLLDGALLLREFAAQDEGTQVTRMKLLSTLMEERWAPGVVQALSRTESSEVRRIGLSALGRLGGLSAPHFAALLDTSDAGLRRMALYEMRRLNLQAFVPVLAAYLPGEAAPGNRDFAEVLMVLLQAGDRTDTEASAALEAVPETNIYRHLALYRLAEIYATRGEGAKAAAARAAAAAAVPVLRPPDSGVGAEEAAWDCMQRKDIEEILDLTFHHRYVEPIDARVYGLPEHDFDDMQNLSIAERLFLRSWIKKQGQEWPTEGSMQYPREIRHTLRDIYQATGMVPDCSGSLGQPDDRDEVMQKDGSEVNASNDTSIESECNVVVNPYNQQYVVATSNPFSSTGNIWYRSTTYGKSFTKGNVLSTSSCDPVSFYNAAGTLYHSYLTSGQAIRVAYSSDNASTWTACSTTNLPSSGMDRQDMYIDTFNNAGGASGWSSSPCLNKIYVGYHYSGAQRTNVSTGTTSPYCSSSWGSTVSLASPGNAGTISTGITSSIGKTSGNGTVIYTFPRYGTSTSDSLAGIYYSLSTNCGTSYTTPVRISTINEPGTFEWGIPSACSRMEYYYVQADSDRQPLSAFRNNAYVTWNDMSSACTPPACTGNTTCNSDIFVAKGVPNDRDNPTSWTWTTVNLTKNVIGTDNYTDEFYPSLTVDQADGDVYVSYYRSNSGSVSLTARQQQVHYVTVRSIDGGSTWQSVLQVTTSPTNEYNSGGDQSMQWGDYSWVDVINGVSYPCWTDRRGGTSSSHEEIYVSKVCSEPTHWVERGATPSVPPTTCANGASAGQVAVSWTLPDLYWGDGGESSANRKFQLYVDGALATDSISATATSTTYSAGGCAASHTYQIRAVNSCGVTKNYGTTTFTPSNCASTPLRVPYTTTPLRLVKNNGAATDVKVTWDATNCASSDYHLLYGTGATVATLATNSPSVSGSKCDLGTTGTLSSWNSGVPVPASGAFTWFLVVGDNNSTTEASWGLTSSAGERGGTAASSQCTCTTKSTSGTCATP